MSVNVTALAENIIDDIMKKEDVIKATVEIETDTEIVKVTKTERKKNADMAKITELMRNQILGICANESRIVKESHCFFSFK